MIEFFQSIFDGALAEDRRLAIFTMPDRRTRHFSTLPAATRWVEEEARTKDVYFGVGLARQNFGHRNSNEDAAAIGGFWADIDFVAPHREKKPLPATLEEAKGLLAELPFGPSLIVDSGYGIHAYWIFKEPWILESDAERETAERRAKGWHGLVCEAAQRRGWRVENLGDLARVMRVPGTFNRKGDEPVPVRVLEEDLGRRFNPTDFEAFEVATEPDAAIEPVAGDIVLRATADPPADKFQSLLRASQAFARAWDRQRFDLADQSQSAYDQSLANIAALNEWSDQEIADLLIAARRRHGDKPEKALRRDYIQRTLGNARTAAAERLPGGVDLAGFRVGVPTGPRTLAQLVGAFPELRPPVIEGLLREGETMNVISAPKAGKALAVDTPILTDGGWTTMGEIRPGMNVHARDGTLTEVIAATEVMVDRPCFRVTTRSGASVVADAEHLWCVRQRGREAIVATKDLAAGRGGRRWQLPVAAPLVRPVASLPLDPWPPGCRLSHGPARSGAMTSEPRDAPDVGERVDEAGLRVGRLVHKSTARRLAECDGDTVTSVEPVPSVPVRCIQVAHPSGTFLAGEALMVTHNSWLVIDLALSIARGTPWLGMPCVPGDVLIVDNELHSETSAHRIPMVAAARGIPIEEIGDRIYVENLRGRLHDLVALGSYFQQFAPGRFKVVILDAFYRFLPLGADENDNGTMANLYNCLDAYADHLKCCFVLIHHTSKGSQSLKDVTDVGAGAGAQSRATDTHLVLRRHEEAGAVVLDAAVRSWPPLPPRCLRWEFPVWIHEVDLDPALLRQEGKRRSKPAAADPDPEEPSWTSSRFVEAFVTGEPKSITRILDEAEQAGLSARRVRSFLDLAEEDGVVHKHNLGSRRVGYATEPAPDNEEAGPAAAKRDAVVDLIRAEPELTTNEVAERCDVSDRYVRRIRTELEEGDGK